VTLNICDTPIDTDPALTNAVLPSVIDTAHLVCSVSGDDRHPDPAHAQRPSWQWNDLARAVFAGRDLKVLTGCAVCPRVVAQFIEAPATLASR
jgi:hypothetical protein